VKKIKCVLVYMGVCYALCCLSCDVYQSDLLVLEVGTLISSKIRASQAKNSQAKPSAWEAIQSVPSHMVGRVIQSALREEQGWTHLLQCQ
jgi:hypothetical protein